ncbi:MAG: OmpA family protein [Proteobacteria bacterium]|nr:OmpA family protein [Pseudomonadota bacterium]
MATRIGDLHSRGGAGNKESPVNAFYLSLSDLMTLLCVFFAVLVGMSRIDVGQFEQVKTAVSGSTKGTLVELASDLTKIATNQKGVSVELASDGVRLDFESAAFFDTGSAVIRPNAMTSLEPILKRILATKYTLDVEGHTDDVPLFNKAGAEIETNWTLSGRRAGSVVTYLAGFGFSELRLRIVGYAANKPRIDVRNKIGAELDGARSANRRVSILVR